MESGLRLAAALRETRRRWFGIWLIRIPCWRKFMLFWNQYIAIAATLQPPGSVTDPVTYHWLNTISISNPPSSEIPSCQNNRHPEMTDRRWHPEMTDRS